MATGAKGEVGRSAADGRFVSMARRGDGGSEQQQQQRPCKLRHLLVCAFTRALSLSHTHTHTHADTHAPPPTPIRTPIHTLTYACFSQIAYFALLDISLLLPVSRDETDEAMRIFHKYGTVVAFCFIVRMFYTDDAKAVRAAHTHVHIY